MIWRSSYHSRFAQLADFITAVASIILAYFVTGILYKLHPDFFPLQSEITTLHYFLGIIISITYVLIFNSYKAYSFQRFTSIVREYTIVLKVTFIGSLIGLAIVFLFGFRNLPRTMMITYFGINLILFLIQKTFLFYLASFIREKGKDRKKVIVVGTGSRATDFINVVKSNFSWGLDVIGVLTGNDNEIGEYFHEIPILDNYLNIERVLEIYNPEEIIITISTSRFEDIRYIIEACEEQGVNVRLNSDILGKVTKKISVDRVFGLSILSYHMVQQSELELSLKRFMDILGAISGLIIFSPFMLIAAIGILLSDGRPIFYQWNVVGLNKKPFKSWKFRTMVKNADELKEKLQDKNEMEGPVFKIKDDPRILHFGKWLRKWSLDETPQLFSVLKGDMSLVGPRPAGPHELVRYKSWHRRKLSIKPGITCLWQVNGRNEISNFNEWVKLDLEYIDNWSILLDIKILFKTVLVVFLRRGAS